MTKIPAKKYRLTGEHFYKFFQCPHWIWYDIYADQSRKLDIPPLMQMIFEDGLRHERQIIKSRIFEEIKPELFKDLDEAFLATVELMKSGKNIYHGVLMDQHWVGIPDLLEARPLEKGMKSKLGDFYYVVYDIKNNEDIKEEHKFQLVFYSLILERIQGVLPREAYIINASGEERSFIVDEFLDYFHLTRERIERILDGEKPAPFLKSGCRQTPWFSLCMEDAKSCDDVSLVYRLSQNDQRRLYQAGIKTIHDLASADLSDLAGDLEDWPFDKLMRFQSQAITLVSGQPSILKKSVFPSTGMEIYFDVESDPTEDIDYLLGVLIKDASGKTEYRPFWADDKEKEKDIWNAFLQFLQNLDEYVVYHYSGYERQVITRLSKLYGISPILEQRLTNSSIDLQKSVTDAVILPLYFYGLKDIAQFLGFSWHSQNAGGAESVVWYNDWLASRDSKIKQKITQYNEDDVRATLFVKEWLERQKPRVEKETLE